MVVTKIYTLSKNFVEQVQASYQQLEHLQHNYFDRQYSNPGLRTLVYENNFHLANLRTFCSQAGDLLLGLHCPQLTELYVYSHLHISEATDEKTKLCIQNLRTLLVHKLSYPLDFEFSNLKVFYFNELTPSISLNDFPRLTELHYLNTFSMVNHRLKDTLDNLLEQKRSLKRNQLKVYFDGFELNDRTDFEVLDTYREPNCALLELCLNQNVLRLIQENSSRLKLSNLLSKELLMSDPLDDELIGLQEGGEHVQVRPVHQFSATSIQGVSEFVRTVWQIPVRLLRQH